VVRKRGKPTRKKNQILTIKETPTRQRGGREEKIMRQGGRNGRPSHTRGAPSKAKSSTGCNASEGKKEIQSRSHTGATLPKILGGTSIKERSRKAKGKSSSVKDREYDSNKRGGMAKGDILVAWPIRKSLVGILRMMDTRRVGEDHRLGYLLFWVKKSSGGRQIWRFPKRCTV